MASSRSKYPVRAPSLSRHASYTSAPRIDGQYATASKPGAISTHARLHKRRSSNSPTSSPTISHSPDLSTLSHRFMDTPGTTMQEEGRRSLDLAVHSARKLRPYLRKLSTREDNSLDLSLPAPELGSPSGLGIHDLGPAPRSVADVTFVSSGGRHHHRRSTSGNSQFSNSSSSGPSGLRQPTAPFLRHTPRQFSDLSTHSQPGSIYEDEDCIAEAGDIMSDEEFAYRQHVVDPRRRSGSMSSSTPNAPGPLHSLSSGSVSRLGSRSQTSLSGLYDPAWQRRDTTRSETAPSPSSRTSLDRALSLVRGRESPMDPASRAASIRAMRAEFQAKEEAKERKAEKEEMKRREREERRRTRQEERLHRKPEMEEVNEKTEPPTSGREHVSHSTAHNNNNNNYNNSSNNNSLPPYVLQSSAPKPQRTSTSNTQRARRPVRSRWAAFVAWFRTRLLRLKCL